MKQFFLVFVVFIWSNCLLKGQDTFSIVAVDSVTGEIGSAGASCLDAGDIAGGASIISDIIPGLGAIHTQSFWRPQNQNNARVRLFFGDSPAELMTWLSNPANDTDGTPARRQYGAVAFDSAGSPSAAAFTGADCFDWKGQLVGKDYAIQGNILLGPQILDSMEARYLRATGTLADRLMAALQGANVPGADSRCLTEGVSSQSAFLRVAGPNDRADSLSLDIIVDRTPFGGEPIDSVQARYDAWKRTVGLERDFSQLSVSVFPQPTDDQLFVKIAGILPQEQFQFEVIDALGRLLLTKTIQQKTTVIAKSELIHIPAGIAYWRILANEKTVTGSPLVIIH